jgi:hypothetical protein
MRGKEGQELGKVQIEVLARDVLPRWFSGAASRGHRRGSLWWSPSQR